MVQFYTIDCPACNILEQRLNNANIAYEKINDVNIIQKEGIFQLPVLKVDNELLSYKQALDWVKENSN